MGSDGGRPLKPGSPSCGSKVPPRNVRSLRSLPRYAPATREPSQQAAQPADSLNCFLRAFNKGVSGRSGRGRTLWRRLQQWRSSIVAMGGIATTNIAKRYPPQTYRHFQDAGDL